MGLRHARLRALLIWDEDHLETSSLSKLYSNSPSNLEGNLQPYNQSTFKNKTINRNGRRNHQALRRPDGRREEGDVQRMGQQVL